MSLSGGSVTTASRPAHLISSHVRFMAVVKAGSGLTVWVCVTSFTFIYFFCHLFFSPVLLWRLANNELEKNS